MSISPVSRIGAVPENVEVSRADHERLNTTSEIAHDAFPAHDLALRDILGSMNLIPELDLVILEYVDSLSIAQATNETTRQRFFANLQKDYQKNHLLKASGCVSVSHDPEAFCSKTAKKVYRMAAHLGVPKDKIAGADSLHLMPTLEMMQPHIDDSLCVVFGKIAEQLPADSSAHKLKAITDEAERARAIRSWMNTPQNEGALNQVIDLDLSRLGLKLLSPEIEKCAHLKQLLLSINQLLELPATIGRLDKLNALYLSYNELQAVPATIGNLGNLKWLCLNRNKLQAVPATIVDLRNLVLLDISYNQLQEVPDTIDKLGNLIELNLSENGLQRVPDGIDKLVNLNRLSLSGNPLQEVSDAIGRLRRQDPREAMEELAYAAPPSQ